MVPLHREHPSPEGREAPFCLIGKIDAGGQLLQGNEGNRRSGTGESASDGEKWTGRSLDAETERGSEWQEQADPGASSFVAAISDVSDVRVVLYHDVVVVVLDFPQAHLEG